MKFGFELSLRSRETKSCGHGWLSGVTSVFLGLVGFSAVLCFRYPAWLTVPALRNLYPIPAVRVLLQAILLGSFVFGALSLWLRKNKALGFAGLFLSLAATAIGGSGIALEEQRKQGPYLGLDWFVLNLILYSVIYIPLERNFALRPEQPTFRRAWSTDLTYFFLNNLLIQILTFLTLHPARIFFSWARISQVQGFIGQLPTAVQVVGILLVADFTQYWLHRAFHHFSWLWRFHAVHHSSVAMDWLAGSRLHLMDAIVTRAASYVPIYLSGFSDAAIFFYLLIVVLQATFIHANVHWRFWPLRSVIVTPFFHHWHHSAEIGTFDKNFAVHLPLWDHLFGTAYLPKRWPKEYGVGGGGKTVPEGWFRQFWYPFGD